MGRQFDAMMADEALRSFVATQPPEGWRSAELRDLGDGPRLEAITASYERGLRVRLLDDGEVDVSLPRAADRAATHRFRPATLPPGVRVIAEPEAYLPIRDEIAGTIVLPSGRLVLEGFGGATELERRFPRGPHEVFVTHGHAPGNPQERTVMLATLVFSDEPTVRWERAGSIGTDSATGGFLSAEAEAGLDREGGAEPLSAIFESLTAHGGVTVHGDQIAAFTTGSADGGYPVFLGLDSGDRPTRLVADFLLMHFAWPQR